MCSRTVLSWFLLASLVTALQLAKRSMQEESDSGSGEISVWNQDTSDNALERYIQTSLSQSAIIQMTTRYVCGSNYLCHPEDKYDSVICSVACLPCYCDQNCSMYGDCCPDTFTNSTRSYVSYGSCFQPDWTELGEFGRALVIGSCASNRYIDREVVRRCENPDPRKREEATPVTDRTSLLTYKNTFCAICNGVLNGTVDWFHRVSCENATGVYSVRTQEDLWALAVEASFCQIKTLHEPWVTVHRCVPPTINSCNVSGNWLGDWDHTIANLCMFYDHPLEYNRSLYGNVFCAICNGATVPQDIIETCPSTPRIPHPLSVLLDFNREVPAVALHPSPGEGFCDVGQVLNPFSGHCVSLRCKTGHILKDGVCSPTFKSIIGLGFSLSLLLTVHGRLGQSYEWVGRQYLHGLRDRLNTDMEGLVIHTLTLQVLTNTTEQHNRDVFIVTSDIIAATNEDFDILENTLNDVPSLSWTKEYMGVGLVTFGSSPIYCSMPIPSPEFISETIYIDTNSEEKIKEVNRDCSGEDIECLKFAHFIPFADQPDCPYVEYNLSSSNISFDSNSSNLTFNLRTIHINDSRLSICGQILTICSDLFEKLIPFFSVIETHLEPAKPAKHNRSDPSLTILSLTCQSVSLLGLLLTVVVYCLLPKLRTIPGLINLILIFHLFCAQLLFLLGSNWEGEFLVCTAFAISIHYFWLATFTWMMASAYHMMKIFTNLRPSANTGSQTRRPLVWYSILGITVPALIVGSCIILYTVRSNGSDIGYGGRVCFITESFAIGVFFAGPLVAMLLFNALCLIKTVMAIRSVPDMTMVSNVGNRRYVVVYIKLSLLFGFTWAFGLLGNLLQSDVLLYIFVLLSGSQGLFIFITFCLKKSIWHMLKEAVTRGPQTTSSVTRSDSLRGKISKAKRS